MSRLVVRRKKKKHYTYSTSLEKCPQKKGVVVKIRIVSPRKPNSAKRKMARVKLSTGKMVSTRIIGQGHNLQSFSVILVSGGRANDLPGVHYRAIKGKYDFNWTENFVRKQSRSKYGLSAKIIEGNEEEFGELFEDGE